uniref:ULP_PROTEASE domain-containing protein n=1 Tax=Globodera pallida TaxID=36090 RepID=A0A183BWD1_GLOPA
MLFQFDHEQIQRHNQQQTATLGETTVAQYLAMESSTGVKLIPRQIKVPMQFVNNNKNSRSALPLLPIQTPPSTSHEQQQQLSPKSQQRTALRSAGTAKVAKREREVHLIDDEESELEANPIDKRSNDTLFSFPPTGRDSCSVHYADLKYLSRNFMLNDTIIDFYLKYIQHCLVPQERRAKIFIFNSFFFGRLTQPPPGGKPSNAVTLATKLRRVASNFQKVKNWTKRVNLFDMDYVVVPINEDIHWYLAIIVNIRHCICTQQVNEPISTHPNLTKNDTKYHPPMSHLIVLNSLIDPAEDKHLAVRDQLGEYLHLEYADKHCQDNATFFNKQLMDVVVPTMLPQQKNFIDCGLFLLHFAQLFFTNPPRIVSRHSSFRRWYPNFEIKHKRDELRCVIMQLASHVKASDFVQRPTPKRKSRNGGRRPQVDKMQSIIDGMALMGRTRRYSDSELDGIMKDEYFSCLYRPRSFDSLVRENREKPLVLQPPTIAEMSRFKQLRRVRQEIFASTVRQGQMQ